MKIYQATLLITAILIMAGCSSSKQTVNRYYVIEPPDSSLISIDQKHLLAESHCEIAPVEIYPAFASKDIANRSGSHELLYYKRHHWAVGPAESLTFILKDYLNQASLFKRTSKRFRGINPDFRLETTVYQLEVVQEQESFSAHLALEFKLFSNPEERLLLSHRADRMEKLQENDLNLFAESIGLLFFEELNRFSEIIRNRRSEIQPSID
ncbi:MAG: ABC-type transport auxiliary lipoprotein family protein [Bacteroidales bacterium]|nr:membrane integrity-associated transporter subunit PqiC [Bacteroidales bacterium]